VFLTSVSVNITIMNQIMVFILLLLLAILIAVIIRILLRMLKHTDALFKTANEIADDVNQKIKKVDGVFNAIQGTTVALKKFNDASDNFLVNLFSSRSKSRKNRKKKNQKEM